MTRITAYHIPNGYDTDRYAPRPEAVPRVPRALRDRAGRAGRAQRGQAHAQQGARRRHRGAQPGAARRARAGLRGLRRRASGRRAGLHRAPRGACPRSSPACSARRDMIAAYSAADLVVHPSLQEIFPNAVGEAMACARPVIAADAGGTPRAARPRRRGRACSCRPPTWRRWPTRWAACCARVRPAPGAWARPRAGRSKQEFPHRRMIDRIRAGARGGRRRRWMMSAGSRRTAYTALIVPALRRPRSRDRHRG